VLNIVGLQPKLKRACAFFEETLCALILTVNTTEGRSTGASLPPVISYLNEFRGRSCPGQGFLLVAKTAGVAVAWALKLDRR